MTTTSNLLLELSNALLLPILGALVVLLALSVLRLGGFLAEAIERTRSRRAFAEFTARVKQGEPSRIAAAEVPARHGLVRRAFQTATIDATKTVDDLELESERLLAKLGLGLRLGPMLGLAGTLVPLGPALRGLADGDLATLADRLVVAFSTTVLGLLIGGLHYAMQSIRRQWYAQDLSDVEFLLARIERPS